MAKISASGQTVYGKQTLTILGDKMVDEIVCDDDFFRLLVSDSIKNELGYMANAFHPPANTMLQAYATLETLFSYRDIDVEGDIGELECEEGVLY